MTDYENICPLTGKYRYPTEARVTAILDANVFRTDDSHPRGFYWCLDCESFHLTSQTPNRFYRRKALRARVRTILTGE